VGSQGGKLLTMSFEGYDITIAERLLSHWPQLDAMCTVYDYSHESRLVGGPLIPSLPVDALTIAGKMGCIEDDTRTAFVEPSCPNGPCVPRNQTRSIIRRNLWSAWLHGSGIYLYDMSGPSCVPSLFCLPSQHLRRCSQLGVLQDARESQLHEVDVGECRQHDRAARADRGAAGAAGASGGDCNIPALIGSQGEDVRHDVR